MHVRIAPPEGVEVQLAARAPKHTVDRAHRGQAPHKLARRAKLHKKSAKKKHKSA
jgi:hypothetical protein